MPGTNIIALPRRGQPANRADRFGDWLSWAVCELSLLGYDLSACDYDWRRAHASGLRPEAAAAQAAEGRPAGGESSARRR